MKKKFLQLCHDLKMTFGVAFSYELGTVTSDHLSAQFFDGIPELKPTSEPKRVLDQTVLNSSTVLENSYMPNVSYMPSFIVNKTVEVPELLEIPEISPFY